VHSGVRANLSAAAAQAVWRQGLRPEDVGLILRRVEQALPHLRFSEWDATSSIGQPEVRGRGATGGRGSFRCQVLAGGADLAAEVRGPVERVAELDRLILRDMAEEAAQLLEGPGRARGSLADFGLATFSRAVARLLDPSLEWEVVAATLRSVRALASETYEGQRIPFGLVLTNRVAGGEPPMLSFENKRLKRLTDGYSTALLLDRRGGLASIVALVASRESVRSRLSRPWWLRPLADTAARVGGLGVALTRDGDLLVAHGRELVVSQRAGLWMLWRHADLLRSIRRSWRGSGAELDRVLAALYRVALELALRRSGGLLVIVPTAAEGRRLVTTKGDLLGSPLRPAEERRLDAGLGRLLVQRADRRIVADLASVDGALIVDRSGRLLAYGAMVRSLSGESTEGARSRAAVAASRSGVAVKISSDGGISVYAYGTPVVSL